jgi:hypothetical protein
MCIGATDLFDARPGGVEERTVGEWCFALGDVERGELICDLVGLIGESTPPDGRHYGASQLSLRCLSATT